MTTHTNQTWNAALYDTKHGFVARFGEDLVSGWLRPQPGESILDLGCGTGHLTSKIHETGAQIVGLDSSPEMIAEAQTRYPDLSFRLADGADFRLEQPVDAVFSNAALHWIHAAEATAARVYEALKPGGRFVAEFGCKGNVAAVLKAADEVLREKAYPALPRPPWYFPSLGEYTTLLETQGFFIASAVQFDRPTPLEGEDGGRNWIRMFGAPLMQTVPSDQRDDFISAVESRLRPTQYREGQWTADYRRLRFVAIKR